MSNDERSFHLQFFAEEGSPGGPPAGNPASEPASPPAQQKPDDSNTPPESVKDPAQKDPPKPVTAEDLKMPAIDGFVADEARTKAFLDGINQKGYTAEQAQFAIDQFSGFIGDFMSAVDAETAKIEQERAELKTAFESDEEIGKGNLKDTKERIAALLSHRRLVSADDEKAIRKLMDETSAGVHPAFGRLLVRVEKALGVREGRLVEGDEAGGDAYKTLGQRLYGKSKKN